MRCIHPALNCPLPLPFFIKTNFIFENSREKIMTQVSFFKKGKGKGLRP